MGVSRSHTSLWFVLRKPLLETSTHQDKACTGRIWTGYSDAVDHPACSVFVQGHTYDRCPWFNIFAMLSLLDERVTLEWIILAQGRRVMVT